LFCCQTIFPVSQTASASNAAIIIMANACMINLLISPLRFLFRHAKLSRQPPISLFQQ
jgi:hypothetical protein